MNKISTLPVWKKNSTAAEWLEELAAMARESPERWMRIAVVLQEIDDNGHPNMTRTYQRGIETNQDFLGTVEAAKLAVWEIMKGREP